MTQAAPQYSKVPLRALVLGMLAALAAVTLVAPVADAAPAVSLSGTSSLYGVSCASSSTCYAVGLSSDYTTGVVVPIINGTSGTPVLATGTDSLTRISCASATVCMAIGETPYPSRPVVVPITNGVPGTPVPFSGGLSVAAISCSSTTYCIAVGGTTEGQVTPISNGQPGPLLPVPGAQQLDGVSCASGSCEAVGTAPTTSGASPGVVVPVNGTYDSAGHDGRPGPATPVEGGDNGLVGVSCPSGVVCQAVGSGFPPGANGSQGATVVINNEVPAGTQIVQEGPPGTDVSLQGVGCSVVGSCEAAGGSVFYNGSQFSDEEGLVVPLVNGVPGAIQAIPETQTLSGLAYYPGTSSWVAVGADSVPRGVVVTSNGVNTAPNYATAQTPPETGTVGSVYGPYTFTATGSPPPSFTTTGNIPPGLTVNALGVLSGRPTTPGTFTFTVVASNGISPNASVPVTISIHPAPGTGPGTPNPLHPGSGTATSGKASVTGTAARVPVACAGAAGSSCAVTLTLTAVETLKGGKIVALSARKEVKPHKRTVVLGRTRVTVAAGHRRVVSVMLNRVGRQLLSARHELSLHLTIIGSGARSSRTVTFRTPVKKHKHH